MVKREKQISEKIMNIILNVLIGIFGILLLITIYNNIQTKILKNSYSSFFGYSMFEVQTGSMADAIHAGDLILVKYQDAINLGDIITYSHDGEFITHRVIEVYKDTFVTKGDFNNTKDDPISKDQVVGKVVKIFPHFGIFRRTLFNPFVLLTLIITLYLAICVFKSKNKSLESENQESRKEISEVMGSIVEKIKAIIKDKIQREKIEPFSEEIEREKESDIIPPSESVLPKEEKIENVNSSLEENVDTMPQKIDNSSDDLEKTMFFRMVSVDQDEIDHIYSSTTSSVAKLVEEDTTFDASAVSKKTEVESKKKSKNKEEKVETELELLQKKKKKFKNILEKTMFIKTEEISEIIEILNQHEKSKTNEASIKKTFLKAYIDGKYYNYCGDINVSYNGKNMISRMSLVLSHIADSMIENYHQNDTKYEEKVRKYEKLFVLVLSLEQAFLVEEALSDKRVSYTNKIVKQLGNIYTDAMLKNIVQDIIKTQKKYSDMVEYSFSKLDTNMFLLNLDTAISKTKKIYAVELEHNITFSKVYSDYIVDKTYKEGVVAEDKIYVLLTLLLRQITKDMLEAHYDKKYLLYIPDSLYLKEKKLSHLFKLFDDECAKNSILIFIKYDELSKYSKIVRMFIKEGYHFALDLEGVEKIKVKDRGLVESMDYLFMSRRNKTKEIILSSLSENSSNKMIYTDLLSKIGDIWGE